MPTPLVSVIMPTYNTARYVQESINSVLEQDYPSIQLIVIDDGSTDETVDIIRRYGERVVVLTQQNQGAAVAEGEYIAFLDSDDVRSST